MSWGEGVSEPEQILGLGGLDAWVKVKDEVGTLQQGEMEATDPISTLRCSETWWEGFVEIKGFSKANSLLWVHPNVQF